MLAVLGSDQHNVRQLRLQLQRKAKETGLTVVVCHVLRYTQFYSTIKALLDRGELGKLETIDATEHVAYWHQASAS